MKLNGYSFKLCRERVDKCHTQGYFPPFFTHPQVWTLLKNNSLLSMMKTLLALVIQLSLIYPHVPDKARMNNHQASYLVSIRLIFMF